MSSLLGSCLFELSDVAGTTLTMDLAARIPGFDYSAFFKGAAYFYMSTTTSATYRAYLASDVHPLGRTRSNLLYASTAKFYETFAIVEGEGMYYPEAKRPKVW